MRRLERRALMCLILAVILFLGVGFFVFRFVTKGSQWATFYGNQGIYSGDSLSSGSISDRYGVVLLQNTEEGSYYNDSYSIRLGTLHAVGDLKGNISTSAMVTYRDKLIGYNLITGTYKLKGKNEDIELTLDAEACGVAYNYLSDYEAGSVGVYNYKTGEVMCLVSTPGFDPNDYTEEEMDSERGIYINRFYSATLTPGSIFKTVTAAAAIECMDWKNFSYDCTGTRDVDGEDIICTEAHGEVDFEDALALSCNCAFSVMTEEIGAAKMREYVEQFGLTKAYDMGGIHNVPGSFEFPSDSRIDFDWAGIGQYNDQLNPCSMMMYMGAVANGGVAVEPNMLKSTFLLDKVKPGAETHELMKKETADRLKEMMKYNVEYAYGSDSFYGLPVGGKTGTGEVEGKYPNATFAGFLDDPDHPYAFVVCVENAGSGLGVAAPIANAVLQELLVE